MVDVVSFVVKAFNVKELIGRILLLCSLEKVIELKGTLDLIGIFRALEEELVVLEKVVSGELRSSGVELSEMLGEG